MESRPTPLTRARHVLEGRFAFVSALATALAVIVCHANTLGHQFALDDFSIIVNNPQVTGPTSLARIFSSDYWGGNAETYGLADTFRTGAYRPLVILSYALQHRVHGLYPLGYHLVNIALHWAACWLLALAARRLGAEPAVALLAALLFAAHPVHTEAVANVVGRAELLAAVGVLLALWLWLGNPGERLSGLGALGASLLYLLAILCKESAIVLPALLLVADWHRRRLRTAWPWYALLAAPLLICFSLRWAVFHQIICHAQPSFLENPLVAESAGPRLWTALRILQLSRDLMLFPLHLAATYTYNQLPVAHTWAESPWLDTLAMLTLIALVAVLVPRWRRATVALGAALLITLALVLNFPILLPTIFGERLLYVPSAVVCLALAAAIGQWSASVKWLAATSVALLLLTAFAARTIARNPVWRNNVTLSRATLLDAPNSAWSYEFWVGQVFVTVEDEMARGETDHALALAAAADQALDRALTIYPEYHSLDFLRAHLHAARGDWDQAFECIRRASVHAPPPKHIRELLQRAPAAAPRPKP